MAVGDVYEVIDVQDLFGQEVQNVYFYLQEAAFIPLAGSIAQALAEEFVEEFIPLIALTQAVNIMHVEVRVRNLFDPTDAGIAVTGVIGEQADTGGILPSFNAWGLQFNTDNASVRPGAKRIAGIAEINQNNGVPTPGMIDALNDLGDALAAPITGGLIIEDDIMFPVVVKRVRSGTSGNYEYRLPETSGELVFGRIIETLVKLLVTSQITRKIGVGI